MKFSTGFTNQHPALNKTHQPAIPRTDQSNNKDVDKSYQLNLTYFTIKVSNFIKREEQSATFQKQKWIFFECKLPTCHFEIKYSKPLFLWTLIKAFSKWKPRLATVLILFIKSYLRALVFELQLNSIANPYPKFTFSFMTFLFFIPQRSSKKNLKKRFQNIDFKRRNRKTC